MPALIILSVLVQACFIVHVFRTGRPYWWAFIILSAPVLGSVVYYFVEVFPGSREARSADRLARDLARSFNPTRELNRRLEALAVSPSVANKVAAADEYARCGGYDKAVELYESALEGVHSTDPDLLQGLAAAHLGNGTFREALRTLDRLDRASPGFHAHDVLLLRARAHEGVGEDEAALALYERLVPVYVGLEARYRQGALLARLGHETQAKSVFGELLDHARRHRIALDSERHWVDAAKRSMG